MWRVLRVFEEETGPYACSERSGEIQIQVEGARGEAVGLSFLVA